MNTNAVASSGGGNGNGNGEGINGQQRFVAQLVSGMIGGVAEQAVFMCPQMCENVLTVRMQFSNAMTLKMCVFKG